MARERPGVDALDYLTLQHLPVVQSSEVKKQEHSKIEEARTSSSQQMGIRYPKTIQASAPGNAKTLKTDGDKMNQLKMAPDCQLSVIDILEDEEPISTGEKCLANEAHVAFSIEGLGKVETATPVHSPEAHSRSFLHGWSSPSKTKKIANSSKDLISEMANLECELDAMMREIDLPFCRGHVEQTFCPKKRVDSFSKPKQKLVFKEFSTFNDNNNTLDDLLGDDELFYGSKDRNEAIWNGYSSPADNILNESGFHLSNKSWMNATRKSIDFSNSTDFRKNHFTFEDSNQQGTRTTMRKAESPAPNFKYQKLEDITNFTLPDMTWHSSIGRDHDFRNLKDELKESCFITEDARESLSLPSEESSSSTAVRGKQERTLLNLKNKLAGGDGDDICHSESVYSEKNMSPRERNRDKWNTPLEEDVNEPGMFTRISNPSRSIQVPQMRTTPKKRLKPDSSSCFEAEYDLEEHRSGCNSFSQRSGIKKNVSSGCRLWTEGLFRSAGDAKSESNEPCFGRFSTSSDKCSPCCNFTKKTHDYCEPNLQNMSRSSIQKNMNLFQVSTLGQISDKPLDVPGCFDSQKGRRCQTCTRKFWNSGVRPWKISSPER